MALQTENKIILYPEYRCRICLEATNGKIALNQTINYKKAEILLNELLEFCVNAQVCKNGKADGLCLSCMEKGIVCYEFKKKFEESQSILLKEIEEGNSFVIKTEEDLKEEDLVVITDNEILKEEILDDDDVFVVTTGNGVLTEEISDEESLTENDEILKEEILLEKEQITENINSHEDKQDISNTPGDIPTAKSLQSKQHRCDICEKIFQHSSGLSRHKRRHNHFHLDKKTASLIRHNLEHTSPEQENTAEYKCVLCEQTFKSQRSLARHAQKVHKKVAVVRKRPCLNHNSAEKKFMCEICQSSFTTSKSLVRHRRTHTGERPHNCSECGKSFAEKGTLRSHLVVHSRKREVDCEVCGATFATSGTLSVHMKTHSADRPFKCTVCTESFKFKMLLKNHMVMHTGVCLCVSPCLCPQITQKKVHPELEPQRNSTRLQSLRQRFHTGLQQNSNEHSFPPDTN